jgi:hypothetical protein
MAEPVFQAVNSVFSTSQTLSARTLLAGASVFLGLTPFVWGTKPSLFPPRGFCGLKRPTSLESLLRGLLPVLSPGEAT